MDTMSPTKKTFETGPVPTECPCGRSIPKDAVTRAQKFGRAAITCTGCGRRWPVPSVPKAEVKAAVAAAAPTVVKPVNDTPDTSVFERAVILSVRLSKLGDRAKVDQDEVLVASSRDAAEGDNDPEADTMGVTKELFRAPEFTAIKELDNGIRTLVKARSLYMKGGRFLAPGSYLQSLDMIEGTMASLDSMERQREEKIQAFADAYLQHVLEARSRLRGLFDPRDYFVTVVEEGGDGRPDVLTFTEQDRGKLLSKFSMKRRIYLMTVPNKLKGLNPALFERELAKAEEVAKGVLAEVQEGMREFLQGVLGNLVEKLQPEPGETKLKGFRGSNLTKLTDFLAVFDQQNSVGQDARLAELVKKIRATVDGVSPDKLKEDATVRTTVQDKLKEVKAALDTMAAVERPKRKVEVD